MNGTEPRIASCVKDEPECEADVKQCLYDKCTWYYVPPGGVSKLDTVCFPVKTCPFNPPVNINVSTYEELTSKCDTYTLVVHSGGEFFKNFHCLFCYGIPLLKITTQPDPIETPTLSIFFDIPRPKRRSGIRTLTGN